MTKRIILGAVAILLVIAVRLCGVLRRSGRAHHGG